MKRYRFYKATNLNTNKAYVGYTSKTVLERWGEHLDAARKGVEYHLHRSIRKYGTECWLVEELEAGFYACRKEAGWREIELIAHYDTYYHGMNMTLGGDGGDVVSKKSPEEMRLIKNKKNTTRLVNYGTLGWTENHWKTFNAQTPEQKKEIGRRKSATIRALVDLGAKVSAGHAKRTIEQKAQTGDIIGEKVRLGYNKRKEDEASWADYIIELKRRTSKVVHTPDGVFPSLKNAVEKTGISSTTLRRRIKSDEYPDFFYVP